MLLSASTDMNSHTPIDFSILFGDNRVDKYDVRAALRDEADKPTGKAAMQAIIKGDFELGSCVIALLSSSSCTFEINHLRACLPSQKQQTTFRESKRSEMNKLIMNDASCKALFEKNKQKQNGWIRKEWFDHKNGHPKRSLSEIEQAVFSIFLSLAVREQTKLSDVSNVWGVSTRTAQRCKDILRKKFEKVAMQVDGTIQDIENTAPQTPVSRDKQHRTNPLSSPLSKVKNRLKLLSPSQRNRPPPTPIFSPTCMPTQLKKARRKSLTPRKIGVIAEPSVEVVVCDDSNDESIDAIISPGSDGIHAIGGGDDKDSVTSGIETMLPLVTPTEDDSFEFPEPDNDDDDDDGEIEIQSAIEKQKQGSMQDDTNFNEAVLQIELSSPPLQTELSSPLSRFLSPEEYPALTTGLKRLADIPKVLKESLTCMGYESVWNALMEPNETATCIQVSKPVGGIPTTWVGVPKSGSLERFAVNARRKKWIDLLLEKAGGDSLSKDDVAAALMIHLVKNYPSMLTNVAETCDMPELKVTKPMDALTSAAMWDEANVPLKGQRIIRRYIRTHLGIKITSPEKHIRKLTNHCVPPVHGSVMNEEEEITFWYRDVDTIIKNLLDNDWVDVAFDEIQVVFGGDHGQGVFGAAVKVILFSNDGEVLMDAVEKVGHIDCNKDTYEILQKTIAKPLNESLIRLRDAVLCVPNQTNIDGDSNSDSHTSSDGGNGDEDDHYSVSFVPESSDIADETKVHKVKLLSVGDLAYVSMSLGKLNMGGKWCYLCDLSPREWAEAEHPAGEVMTNSRMKEIRDKVASGEISKDRNFTHNRKGCITAPLFSVFEPSHHTIPCLHVMMGAMNDAMNGWLNYVEQRHENITEKEKIARQQYWKSLNDLQDAEEAFQPWLAENETKISELRDAADDLAEKRAERNRTGTRSNKPAFKHSKADRKLFLDQIKEYKEEINQLKKVEIPARENEIKEKQRLVSARKQLLQAIQRKRSVQESKLRQSMDRILKKHGVDRGASHGGDFSGVACLTLENRIEEIFGDFKALLRNHGNGNFNEIEEFCKSYKLHLLLLSHMFSLARSTKQEMRIPEKRASIIAELDTVIPLVDKSTSRLGLSMETPKRHLFSDHLVLMMKVHDGLGECLEDWLEQTHQRYRSSMTRAKMRGLLRADYECRNYIINHNAAIKATQEEVARKSKRTFHVPRVSISNAEKKRNERHGRRLLAVTEATGYFEANPALKTSLQRNLAEERNRLAADDDAAEEAAFGEAAFGEAAAEEERVIEAEDNVQVQWI